MASEVFNARESRVNPINAQRSGQVGETVRLANGQTWQRQRSAPPGYANSVSYPEEYWRLQRELMRMNGILGV